MVHSYALKYNFLIFEPKTACPSSQHTGTFVLKGMLTTVWIQQLTLQPREEDVQENLKVEQEVLESALKTNSNK